MSRDAEYRLKALECAEAAERLQDLRERLLMLEMAQLWMKMADRVRGAASEGAGPGPASPEGAPVINHDAER